MRPITKKTERIFNHSIKENSVFVEHTIEDPDDMPAHIKASLLGNSLIIPVGRGRLLLGTWQGIYLGEHRYDGDRRKLVLTLLG